MANALNTFYKHVDFAAANQLLAIFRVIDFKLASDHI